MKRIDNLIAALALQKNEAVVLHFEPNMYYLSGYHGEGLVVVSKEIQAIITDFRYTEQAEKQAPGFAVHMIGNGKGHNAVLAECLQKHSISRLYVEQDVLSFNAYHALQKAVGNVELLDLGNTVANLRAYKDEQEVSFIAKACQITGESFMEILPYIKEGVTERELTARLEYIMKVKGSHGNAFDVICAAGKNGSLPHAVPSDYKVQLHDMITFDFGAEYEGYCADMTRTCALGTPSDTMLKVYNTVKEAQAIGLQALKPGVVCSSVDKASRDYIYAHGFEGRFGHGLGHAVGIEIHENPRLSAMCEDIVQVNHILTVEPGIYLPNVGGVRIEDTCLVTETGNRPLTEVTKDLIIL